MKPLSNPDVVSKDWKDFFTSLSETDGFKNDIIYSEVVDSFKNKVRKHQNNIKEYKKLVKVDIFKKHYH